MSWIIAIVVGGIVGWIASAIMRQRQTIWVDVIVGIIGAFLARWFFGSVLGIGSALTAGSFSALGILWGIIGAVVLITIFRLVAPEYYRNTSESGKAYYQEMQRDLEEKRREREREDREKHDK